LLDEGLTSNVGKVEMTIVEPFMYLMLWGLLMLHQMVGPDKLHTFDKVMLQLALELCSAVLHLISVLDKPNYQHVFGTVDDEISRSFQWNTDSWHRFVRFPNGMSEY